MAEQLWKGRFSKAVDSRVNDFNSSIRFDQRMIAQDMRGSGVHAAMLAKQGIISEKDCEDILSGLASIADDLASGALEIDPNAEDVHTFVEQTLTARIGDAQVAGIGIMMHPGQYFQMLISQITINKRYSFMSISVGQKAYSRFSGISRWILGFMMTDEIFAVASQEDSVSRSFFAGLSTLPYIGWAVGTLIGAILGSILPDRLMSALSLAIYGMFVAIVVPEMKKSRAVVFVVVLALVLSCMFYYVPFLSRISSGITITVVAIVAAVVGSLLFPVADDTDKE